MLPERIRLARPSSVFTLTLLLPFLAAAQHVDWKDYSKNLAPFVPSPEHVVDKMLEAANLKPGETLYDLGCGDGRILIAAAQRYKAKAVGIEISEALAKTVAEKVKKEGLQKRITIIHGDFMKTDLSQADVVTLYLATTANDTVRPNLEHFLHPHARVVSYDYPVPGWKPVETKETSGDPRATHTIYLYQVPDSIKK